MILSEVLVMPPLDVVLAKLQVELMVGKPTFAYMIRVWVARRLLGVARWIVCGRWDIKTQDR